MTPTIDHVSYLKGRIVWTVLLVALGVYYAVIRFALARPGVAVLTDASLQRNVFLALSAAMVAMIFLFDRGTLPLQSAQWGSIAFTRHLVCWALAESIGLYGVVLAFQTRRPDETRVFLLAAAALLVWLRPRPERFSPDK
jgi:hypothetical protein